MPGCCLLGLAASWAFPLPSPPLPGVSSSLLAESPQAALCPRGLRVRLLGQSADILMVSSCGSLSSVALSVGSGQRCAPISKRAGEDPGARSASGHTEGRVSVGVRETWGWRAGWRTAGLSAGASPLACSDTRRAQSGPLGKASRLHPGEPMTGSRGGQ